MKKLKDTLVSIFEITIGLSTGIGLFIIKLLIMCAPLVILYSVYDYPVYIRIPFLIVLYILVNLPFINIIAESGVMIWSAVLFFNNSFPLFITILFYISFVLWILHVVYILLSLFADIFQRQ